MFKLESVIDLIKTFTPKWAQIFCSFWQDKFYFQYKRSTNSNEGHIRGPYNANELSRYVELVLVTDKAEFEKYGHSTAKIHQRCKDIANIVNAVS